MEFCQESGSTSGGSVLFHVPPSVSGVEVSLARKVGKVSEGGRHS